MGGGGYQDCRWGGKKTCFDWVLLTNHSHVRASFSQQRDPDTLVLSSVVHLTRSLLCLVKNVNKRNQTVTFFFSFSYSNATICCCSLEVVYPPCKGCSLSVCNLFKMMPRRPCVVFVQFKKGWLSVVFMLLHFFLEGGGGGHLNALRSRKTQRTRANYMMLAHPLKKHHPNKALILVTDSWKGPATLSLWSVF